MTRTRRRRTDPKIDRLRAQALGLSRRDATWLAAVADEVEYAAGATVGDHRFAHVVLHRHGGVTAVDADSPPLTLADAATVLVLSRADARELAIRRGTAEATRPAHGRVRLAV